MKHHPAMTVVTIIMILTTAFAFSAGVGTIITNQMPFDMHPMVRTYPVEVGVMLLIYAGVMTLADIWCLRVMYASGKRTISTCNTLCFAAWLLALATFIIGMSTPSITWIYFLALTLPPLAGWFATSPKIAVAGDAW